MKNLFIFNVGNSDVQLRSEAADNTKCEEKKTNLPPARDKGQQILKDYNQFTSDALVKKSIDDGIYFPIIERTLVIKEFDPNNSKIILFFTDQDSKNSQDTIYYGLIIKIHLEFVYKGQMSPSDIELIEINQNPADFDLMKDFYNTSLARIAEENRPFNFVFASLTGGTPAQNTMLLFCGLNIFTNKFRTLYTSIHTKITQEMSIAKNLIKDDVKNQIALLIRQGEYHAALEILNQNRQLFQVYSQDADKAELPLAYNEINYALEYAHSRQVFDFKKALQSIDTCLRYSSTHADYFKKLREQVSKLQGNDLLCIAELKENSKHLYNAGHYVDFLGRIFRLFEAICDYVLLKTNNECRKFIKKGKVNKVNIDKKDKKILDFIASECDYTVSNGKVDTPLNNRLRLGLLTYIDSLSGIERLSDYMYVLYVLSDLRNKTIMSHGFTGVSSEEIEKCIRNKHNELKSKLAPVQKYSSQKLNSLRELSQIKLYNNDVLLQKRCETFDKIPMKEVSGSKALDICSFLDIIWDKFTEYTEIKEKIEFHTDLFYRKLPNILQKILGIL